MTISKYLVLAFFIFIIDLNCQGVASAYTLALSSASGNPGDTVNISFSLHLDAGEDMLAANVDVFFDPIVLEYTGVTWGSGFSDYDFYNATTPGPGVPPITFSLFCLDPKIGPEDIFLASIDFLIKPITSDQVTEASVENDELFSNVGTILEGYGVGATIEVTNEVTVIPEPSSALLITLGLAGLVIFRNRKI